MISEHDRNGQHQPRQPGELLEQIEQRAPGARGQLRVCGLIDRHDAAGHGLRRSAGHLACVDALDEIGCAWPSP